MVKVLKILSKLVGGIFEWVLILLIIFAFAIRTSYVQTYLANAATAYLSEELNTTVRIDAVDIVFIDRVDLKGVLLLDQQKDTIAKINSLLVNVSGLSAFNRQIYIDDVTLDGGVVKINRDAKTGDYNYWFLQDYFDSGTKKKKSDPLPLRVDNIHISDIRFHYDDYRKSYSEDGMDYDHLAFTNVHLSAERLQIKNGIISANIEEFAAKESCGFDLQKFDAYAIVSENGFALHKLKIQTPNSFIKSKDFKFLYSGYTDFREFVDSVAFDVKLSPSKISLKDIAYFAPALSGMDQVAVFNGKITNKVKDLKIENFELATGEKTKVKGTIRLPDFRNLKGSFYSERLEYAMIDINDLQNIKMPKSNGKRYIEMDPAVQRLHHFEALDVRFDGLYSQFVVSADIVKTGIGSINLDNGILFKTNEANKSLLFTQSEASTYDVKVNNFQLDKFLDDDLYGSVDGTFFLSGEAFSFSDIHFTSIQGDVNRFDLADYSYSGIRLEEGSFIDKVIIAKAKVNDKNLDLTYEGTIDLNGEPRMDMEVNIEKAFLTKLGFTDLKNTNLVANGTIHTVGLDPNKMRGEIAFHEIVFKEQEKIIRIPTLALNLNRSEANDVFELTSSLASGKIEGKVDFNNIVPNFQGQFARIFPGLYTFKDTRKKYNGSKDHFTYNFTTGDLKDVLAIFVPDLSVSPETNINGEYKGSTENFEMSVESNRIAYQDKVLTGIDIKQSFLSDELNADYHFDEFAYNDSIKIQDVSFHSKGNGDNLESELTWNPETTNESKINWKTTFESTSRMNFNLEPSYFSLNEKRWEIANASNILLDSTDLEVTNLNLTRNEQFIKINGHVSKNDNDKLKVDVNDVDLNELSVLIGLQVELSGKLNGWASISNPYTNLSYMGDLNIQKLTVNEEEIGDVYVLSEWDRKVNTVKMQGEIMYKGIQSLDFHGHYYASKETDNLDMSLLFDETNIAFTNAFMDPKVISDISGFVDGSLKVRGTPERPIIEGEVVLEDASAKLAILGTSFSMTGSVKADEDGFYIDNMPLTDAEGNTGSLIGSIYHSDYKNWNFDVSINLEEDGLRRDPFQSWRPLPLNKFLVMNTTYKPGEIYYGKAYGTGNVDIFGYADNLEITVDMKTEKGTAINFPMYGTSDIEGSADFITFKSNDTTIVAEEKKIDFTGVDLDLNFRVTPDADLKIIFNEQLGDEILAKGNANMSIKLNQLGDLSLDGTYYISEGSKYNFAMGPVKQTFYIVEGGSIAWTGNPYEATLNLSTYYRVKASLAELSSDQISSGLQEVQCYLNLTESLMQPTIGFDIKVPKADESGKALVARVTSDKDELNRQFFSLLLTKNFSPLKGSTKAGGGAALDLVSSQINSLLDQINTQGYKLNVDLSSDQVYGNEVAFGVTKGFLDDRLTITGSFGVENNNAAANNQSKSSLIGDLELEYKLNEAGTFRVNVFNESNDNTSGLEGQNQGRFTQGAGVHYKEDFNNAKDFRAMQTFFDIFRKKENKRYPIKRKKQQTPVPKEGIKPKDVNSEQPGEIPEPIEEEVVKPEEEEKNP